MDAQNSARVTQLLSSAQQGQAAATSELFDLVYEELRILARSIFNGQARDHTLQPTALVHEAWFKLVGNLESIEGRRHFFAVAAKAMRQILTDHARAAGREKRGGKHTTMIFYEQGFARRSTPSGGGIELIEFDDALSRLAALNARHARVAEMRLLCTMTILEIADELELSEATIEKDWRMARAWLNQALQ